MPPTDHMLNKASRKRDLGKQIREHMEGIARDPLRAIAIKQAEKLEAEATALETVRRSRRA